jgi:hypothetical protein
MARVTVSPRTRAHFDFMFLYHADEIAQDDSPEGPLAQFGVLDTPGKDSNFAMALSVPLTVSTCHSPVILCQ